MVGQYQNTADINGGTGIVVIGLACLIIGETVLGRHGGKRCHRHRHRFDYLPFYLRYRPIQKYACTGAETGHRCDRKALAIAFPTIRKWAAFRHVKMQLHAGREDTGAC